MAVVIMVFFLVVVLLPILVLTLRLRNDEFVTGGSFGRQIFGRNKDKQDEL
jgi:hypothetical protein